MASRSHCDECHLLADLYLERVTDHVRLMEEQAKPIQDGEEDAGDLKWFIGQAERRIREARRAFFLHRASHNRHPEAI